MFKNNFFLLIFFCNVISCYSQQSIKTNIPIEIDSIEINFEVISSTVSFDNCKNLDDEFLKRKDTYKIIITNPDLVQLFKIDSSKLKYSSANMYFDATISMFKNGQMKKYCVNRNNYNLLSDEDGNTYKIPKSNYIELLNYLIYFNYKQGLVDCLTDNCDYLKDDSSLLLNLLD